MPNHTLLYIICFEVFTLINSLKTQDQLVYEVLGVTYVEIWNNLLHFSVDFAMLWIQISTHIELLQY